MKILNKCVQWSGLLLSVSLLTGCAAGSATAGYALKAREADFLSAQGEQRVTERVKREVLYELNGQGPQFTCDSTSY